MSFSFKFSYNCLMVFYKLKPFLMVTTISDAQEHHVLYFMSLEKVTLKSTLNVGVAYTHKNPL